MKNNLLKVVLAVLATMLGIFDGDSFSMIVGGVKSGWVYYAMNPWYYGDLAYKLYSLIFLATCYSMVLALNPELIRRNRYNYYIILAAMTIAYASLRILVDGHGAGAAFAGTEIRGFMLIGTLPLLVFCTLANFSLLPWFVIPFCIAIFLKSILLIYGYIAFGGVEFMTGVRSVVVDGNALNSLSIGVLIALALATYLISKRRYAWAAIAAVICLLLVCMVAGSFRRLVLIKALTGAGIFMIVISYIKGRLLENLPYMAAFVSVLGALVGVAYAAIFGLADAEERLRSLNFQSETGSYSGSNKFYIEDWTLLGETLIKTGGLGVGFRNEYGISVRSDMGSEIAMANTEIPLHTGLYELWGRLGIFGAIFHLLGFIIIPISAIKVARVNQNDGAWLVAPSAAWLLFLGLFPFGPPPYLNITSWFYCSFAIGCLMAGVSPALMAVRPDRIVKRGLGVRHRT
jgi:hypothetical protein